MRNIVAAVGAIGAIGIFVVLSVVSSTAQAPVPIPSVWLQSSTPGTNQTGNMHINGAGMFDRVGLNTSPTNAKFQVLGGGTTAAIFDGFVRFGDTTSGNLTLIRAGTGNNMINLSATGSGGELNMFDETNNIMAGIEPDVNGTGGFLFVFRNAANLGFSVDGNNGGTGEPLVTIGGSARSAIFDMGVAGNSSVLLPNDAISAAEILDEPGTASNSEGTASVGITTTALTTILSRTITVPTSGYVLVMATTQFQIPHVTGTTDSYNLGVSDSSSALPVNQDLNVNVLSAEATGAYQRVVTPQTVFPVTAGVHTYYFLGEKVAAASADALAFDTQLTILFIPTSYGTVAFTGGSGSYTSGGADDESNAPTRGGMTDDEIADEQRQSIRDNQERLRRELAEMKARFDAMQKQLDATYRKQFAASNRR